MSKRSKIVIIIGVIGVLVFGFTTSMVSRIQNGAKKELIEFLRVDCLMQEDIVTEKGVITREALSFIKKPLGD